MTAITHKKRTFGSGELDEDYWGHDDYRVHQSGLAKCANLVVTPGGGLKTAPATEFLGLAKPNSRFIGIDFRANDSFMMEVWNGRARFFRNRALLLNGAVPYEITNLPYLDAELSGVRWQRSGDVLYLTHPTRGMWQLARIGNVNWQSAAFAFKVPPFADENTDKTKTIQASAIAAGATITLTATGFVFDPLLVGETLRLREFNNTAVPMWDGETFLAPGQRITHNGNHYQDLRPGGAGNAPSPSPPVHTEGIQFSGANSGPIWEFRRRNYGLVKIVSVAPGGATASAQVLVDVPEEFLVAPGSHRWSEEAFSSRAGWPVYMNIQQQRFYLYSKTRFYYSKVGDYLDYTTGQTPELGGSELLGASTDRAIEVQWAVAGRANLVGGVGEEFSVSAASGTRQGVSAADLAITNATTDGSNDVEAIKVKNAVLHVGPDGTRLYEISYDFQIDDYTSRERSLPSAHLFSAGIRDMDFQRDPLSIVWLQDGDGQLIGYTYNPEQEILGFHSHPKPNASLTSLGLCSRADVGTQDVYLRMRREIAGRVVETVECMLPFFNRHKDKDPLAVPRLDCQSTALGDGMSSVTGLAHFANACVRVVTDKGDLGELKVTAGGQLHFGRSDICRAVIGLATRFHLKLLPLAPDMETGSTEGRTRQVAALRVRALGCGKVLIGNIDADHSLAEAMFDDQSGIDGPVVFLRTEGEGKIINQDWHEQGMVDIWSDDPFHFQITSSDRVLKTGGH